jgi:hypothetical protein
MHSAIMRFVALLAALLSTAAYAGDREISYEEEPIVPPMESVLADTASTTPAAPAPAPGDEAGVEEEAAEDEEG